MTKPRVVFGISQGILHPPPYISIAVCSSTLLNPNSLIINS